MATQLVPFTVGRTVSNDVSVEAGATQTLQGVFKANGGRVEIQVKSADDSYTSIGHLTPAPLAHRVRQVVGPLQLRVITKNAGCDLGE